MVQKRDRGYSLSDEIEEAEVKQSLNINKT
jgi:hypothetical protein